MKLDELLLIPASCPLRLSLSSLVACFLIYTSCHSFWTCEIYYLKIIEVVEFVKIEYQW